MMKTTCHYFICTVRQLPEAHQTEISGTFLLAPPTIRYFPTLYLLSPALKRQTDAVIGGIWCTLEGFRR